MSAFLANVAVAVAVLVLSVSILLTAVGALSYRRIGSTRLLWVTIAFVGFAVQGLLLLLEALDDRSAMAPIGLVSLGILIALYAAVLR